MNIETTLSILIFGSLLFLSFLLLTNPMGVNRRANKWLGAFFLLWGLFWIEDVPQLAPYVLRDSIGSLVLHILRFCTVISFYYTIVFFTNPEYKFRRRDQFLLIPYTLYIVVRSIYYLSPSSTLQIASVVLLTLTAALFISMSYFRLLNYQNKVPHFASETSEIELNWLKYLIIGVCVVLLFVTAYNIVFYPSSLGEFINLFMLVMVYFSAYNALRQREIYPDDVVHRKALISIDEPTETHTKKKIISDEDLVLYKSKLVDVMKEKKPYLDCEINLAKLAELSDMSTHQLSYVINNGFDENFFQFVNKHRVEKAKELLLSKDSEKLSMIGIAFEAGFNSKTSFNTTFKKLVGQTPSEFKK